MRGSFYTPVKFWTIKLNANALELLLHKLKVLDRIWTQCPARKKNNSNIVFYQIFSGFKQCSYYNNSSRKKFSLFLILANYEGKGLQEKLG